MNNQEQVSKLQGLLARIQRNASVPRGGAPLAPPPAFAPTPALPSSPPPVAATAAGPTPYAPPAPAYIPPAPSFDEQSLDDLLGVSESAPVEVEMQLDTLPPVADVSAVTEPEADPIPLVSVATHESSPPAEPFDSSFLDSEVSEVRPAPLSRAPGPEVTVAAIEAEAEPIVTEELSEDDLVEVTEGTPLPASELDIDFNEEEQAPVSSQRQVASNVAEALAGAAEVEADREVPLKTPPPESGPQAAPAVVLPSQAAPDVDALLGQELDIPTHGEVPASAVPTPEQLGQTIDLEEARGPSLELAEPPQLAAEPATTEELEVALPGREVAGGYDESLLPPPEAREDLEAHRRRLEDDNAPPPESLATFPSVPPGPAPEIVPVAAAPGDTHAEPEIIARAAPEGVAETFTSVREPFRPRTFVELLDASLSLG